MKLLKLFGLLSFIVILFSCNIDKPIIGSQIYDVEKIGILKDSTIDVDYKDAYANGFVIPSIRQTPSGKFILSFKVKNLLDSNSKFYYKIYYQNESYKFEEFVSENLSGELSYNKLASENFYGSYKNTDIEFKSTIPIEPGKEITILDSIQIVGNPRNEEKFFNYDIRFLKEDYITDGIVNHKLQQIRNDSAWFKSITDKAISNNITVDKQLMNDAIWLITDSLKINNRWQRNPRMGKYSLLIVVSSEQNFEKIPEHIKNISKKSENTHINPYYYFLYGQGKSLTSHNLIDNFITVKATIPINKGIYVYKWGSDDSNSFNNDVNNYLETNRQAGFEYYRNERVKDETVNNINLLTNDFYKKYTIDDYKKDSLDYLNNKYPIIFTNSSSPGATFGYDSINKRIWFHNPASKPGDLHKENVGIKTRHAITYGKYTFKVNMAELLNKHQVWTGLTNSLWMVAQAQPSNERRYVEDKSKGYMPYYGAGEGEERVNQIAYTEIDFEIVKAPQYWPKAYYYNQEPKVEPESNKNKVMVTCTNWDMACKEPENFSAGIQYLSYEGKEFEFNRWTEWYNALTSKTPELDDELFGRDYYYFQLEWKPKEIIWRIGPEKDDLRLVGYMNDKVTSIPNNQMNCILTQEYHHTHWWPESAFAQENIPFIDQNIEGYLYSIEIE